MKFAGVILAAAAAGAAPQVFAPGVVSTPEWESHLHFSPDGSTLLFVKSDAEFGDWKIWEAHRTKAGWSAPQTAAFSGDYLDADPFFAADGKTLYFISTRPAPGKTGDDLDIWTIERTETGWGEGTRLPAPVNSPGKEWFPRVAANGDLYFGSDREGGNGKTDIYVARKEGEAWQVENLHAPVSTDGNEYEFEIAPDGSFAFLMASRPGELGNGDIYVVYRDGDGWSEPLNLGPIVNSPNLEVGPLISRDGKIFYWSSARDASHLGDIYRMPLAEALKLAPRKE